jgi:hypothetical protein
MLKNCNTVWFSEGIMEKKSAEHRGRWPNFSSPTAAVEYQKTYRILLNYLQSAYVRKSFGDIGRKVSPLLHVSHFTSKAGWPQVGFSFVQMAGDEGVPRSLTDLHRWGLRKWGHSFQGNGLPRPSNQIHTPLQFFLLSPRDEIAKHAIKLSFTRSLAMYTAAFRTWKCI